MSSNDKNFRDGYYNDDYVNENVSSSNYRGEQQSNSFLHNKNVNNNNLYHDDCYNNNVEFRSKKVNFKKILFWIIGGFIAFIILILAVSWTMSLFVPDKTNVLIMATDEDGTRTDTLMLATYDKNSKSITLISIPRDTYVSVNDDVFEIMKKEYPQPQSKSMKINAVHHYGGKKHGVSLVKSEVEKLMGIDIDYYIKVDFEAFRYIIDSVGGIEFYVPQNMEYNDPYQNLYISLKEGSQILNGEQAEHLLRFRSGYADADLGRVRVQQDFIKAFISQTFSKGTILSNPGVYLNAVFKYNYVETDAGVFDILSYAMLVGGINTNNIESYTLPGYADTVNGQAVYRPNISEIENLNSKITCN